MRTVGIVGHGSDKFTTYGENIAKGLIRRILNAEKESGERIVFVSGHSPMGGIDIWGEEIASEMGIKLDLKTPEIHQWNPRFGYGYKARNLDIAASDIVHVLVARDYPEGYTGRRFDLCYHCKQTDHVKSGGCWTGLKAKNAVWHLIPNC